MERGTYTHYSQKKLPRRKRTRQLKGTFEDRGKYIRCWNCGFIVDVTRDLGDSEFGGVYVQDGILTESNRHGYGDINRVSLSADLFGEMGVMLKLGAVGEALPTYTLFNVKVSHGCPFCGCSNLS